MAQSGMRMELFYGAGIVAVVIGVALVTRLTNREVRFCRAVFADLARGRQSVQRHVDWERLNALGVNVGATYSKLPNDEEKTKYRKAFVEQFAQGFERSGATVRAFTNWRVEDRQKDQLLVEADYPAKKKTLVFSIPVAGPRQLEAIQWK